MLDLFLWACLLVVMACSGVVVKTGVYVIYKATGGRKGFFSWWKAVKF